MKQVPEDVIDHALMMAAMEGREDVCRRAPGVRPRYTRAGGSLAMTKVAIVSGPANDGAPSYRAVAGDKQSAGRTAGEALDALVTQLPEDAAGTIVVVQSLGPDRFFTAAQRQRLADLMQHWRAARDAGTSLPPAEQAELDSLAEAELQASAERAAALLRELGR